MTAIKTARPQARPDTRPQVVFFGSGPVAAASLELLAGWCDIEAVITKPQPPHHKQPFPVLELAAQLGLPVYTPYGKAELSAVFAAFSDRTAPTVSPDDPRLASRLGVVIDYGFIINQDVIDYFPLGIINSHFSLLPEWRGADPISFSILSGQPQTGVSLMRIVAAMDEGPILSQGVHDLTGKETTPQLTNELIELSDALLRHALPLYLDGGLEPVSQEAACQQLGRNYQPTYSRKLSKEDGQLDFGKPAAQLEREVRAYIEWPRSRMILAGKDVVVTQARAVATPADDAHQPGEAFVYSDDDGKAIAFRSADGLFVIDGLKPAGKPAMPASAFLAGNTL